MTTEDFKEFKKLYNKVSKAAKTKRKLSASLDRLINKYYGFRFSDYDIEPIIDTIDYGINDISFKDFIAYMNEQRDKLIESKFDNWDPECKEPHAME